MTDNQTPQQTKLLICGSRYPTPAMVSYAKLATQSAYNNSWMVYAGDAIGIDSMVASATSNIIPLVNIGLTTKPTISYFILVIVGLGSTPRHGFNNHKNIEYVRLPAKTYTARDRYMVENSDKVMCIWNGKSVNSGTYKNYLHACELNKQAWLVNQHGKIIKTNEV